MEYLWYIIAAAGAGVGTGLAGLSAATVMVPILIVLCPSFTGETGAYQATAIALASDILGSAVTACTYAKNRKLDLKRGWLMLVCILSMCTVGSYVAWLAGNVVLGSFTLFLTFCIGIRFLIKPDTSREEPAAKGEKLGWKGAAISLFFGLTIGFGTGFVGTGGGMMMLVVFTAFLGMELKTAVGTSTFIMTFTALIASIAHIAIHPAIVLERWDALLICITIATATSLFSARFANRVNNRTVGLVTGAVLTVLGAAMLLLHFWDFLSAFTLFAATLQCLGSFVVFIIPCVAALLIIKAFTRVPRFVFRKLLHLVAFCCVTLMIVSSDSWLAASLASVTIAALIYPILALLENESWYADLFVEKSHGEIKRSLLMLFLMFAAITAVAGGLCHRPELAALAILMWGTGDGMAALIGIPFGKHKLGWKYVHPSKSREGTAAMFLTAFVTGALFVLFFMEAPPALGLLTVLAGAFIGTLTELFSPSEWDTVTVPIAILLIVLLFRL